MKFRLNSLVIFTTALAMAVAIAAVPVEAAKKKRDPGKRAYMRNTCIACHGRNGRGAMLDYPNLAGQDAKYMRAQIKDIMAGKRTGSPDPTGNPRSAGMRGALVTPEGEPRITPEQIKTIVAWLAKQTPAAPTPPEKPIAAERISAGEKLYKKKCRSCHGKKAMKPLKGYPVIAGQKHAYLVTQIKDIKAKARTNGKSKLMLATVKKLSDDQIGMLADYLSQIDRTKK
ncbi:MAG: c-type cytochrome [Rhodospirillaceae bacterium]|mgnify:CR=1 FL=1|nr:c-type cytochrome [Rhodospirillaceae bacterium]